MIKRPLNEKFSAAVLEGRKITIIRSKPWPSWKPIMLYNWSGAAYRSPQIDIAAIEVEETLELIVTHDRDGGVVFSRDKIDGIPIHQTEGFDNAGEMQEWFSKVVPVGKTVELALMRFRLVRILQVAALFVQAGGCYASLPFVDPWPQERDARNYTGSLPVVAHPPCQLWGPMAAVNFSRWGGEHNRPGNDGGCFAAALEAVRKWGGVLEHPAATRAWTAHNLTPPVTMGWQKTMESDWVCEVWQSAYGHRANKATWLLYHGKNPPLELRWKRIVGTHQIGWQDQRGKSRNKPTLGPRESSATPELFRDALIALSLHANSDVRSMAPNDIR